MLISGLYLIALNSSILLEWNILLLINTPVKFILILDPVGLTYAATVLFIASNVIRFSKYYMKDDLFINRFSILVMLFVLSITLLIFIPHFIALLLGWDGLGITSFILVIYYQNSKSLAAGIITALTNRIGDVIILISIAMTLNQGHWRITHMWESPIIKIQIIAILVAGCTKRAQIPFSSWLPAAIAAPTPVSALVHSSTLVTAGVFLIIRFYPFLSQYGIFNKLLLFVAVSTIFIAGVSASTECDIKKIIALSTLRQLGVIICSLGLGNPIIALFHIITHALFKSLLFICAGQLIADHLHGQELRWMGAINNQNPISSSCILIANFALCGMPFMAGFYSKDLIIEFILVGGFNRLIAIITLIAVGFTTLYSIRFILVIAWRPRNHTSMSTSIEISASTTPMVIIATCSIITGSCILWILPIYVTPFFIPLMLKIVPLYLITTGLLVRLLISNPKAISIPEKLHLLNYASCLIWFLVPLSSQPVLGKPILAGRSILKLSDNAWLEFIGSQGVFNFITLMGRKIQSSSMYSPSNLLLVSSSAAMFTLITTYLLC